MNSFARLPKKHLLIILITLSGIILAASLEVMTLVKDQTLFIAWQSMIIDSKISAPTDFNTYVTLHLSVYFSKIILPMVFGIYAYFAYIKIRINGLFVFIWTVLLMGNFAYNLVGFKLDSIFFYINIVLYSILIITVLSLIQIISESKTK